MKIVYFWLRMCMWFVLENYVGGGYMMLLKISVWKLRDVCDLEIIFKSDWNVNFNVCGVGKGRNLDEWIFCCKFEIVFL